MFGIGCFWLLSGKIQLKYLYRFSCPSTYFGQKADVEVFHASCEYYRARGRYSQSISSKYSMPRASIIGQEGSATNLPWGWCTQVLDSWDSLDFSSYILRFIILMLIGVSRHCWAHMDIQWIIFTEYAQTGVSRAYIKIHHASWCFWTFGWNITTVNIGQLGFLFVQIRNHYSLCVLAI